MSWPDQKFGGGGITATPAAAVATPVVGATVFVDTSDRNVAKYKATSGAVFELASTNVLNVKTYGATGNGTTDDTAAIQSAINAASALVTAGMAGVAVYFPTGKYKQTAAINVYPHIRYFGDSGGNSILWQTGLGVNGAGTTISNPYHQLVHPAGGGTMNTLFEHLTFLGENGINGVGFVQATLFVQDSAFAIYMPGGCVDVEIRYCAFKQLWGFLARSDGNGANTRMHHCTGYQCAGEVNLNDDGSMVCDNVLDTCWAIESAAPRVQICRNRMINCRSGVAIGGDGGYQFYQPDGPLGTIIGATNTTPITIQTAKPHGIGTLQAPAQIRLSGVVGNTAANGTWSVTWVDSTHLILNSSAGNGAYSSGGKFECLGDFGCQVLNNVIDITRLGSGIDIGSPVVGALISGNQISRVAAGYPGIATTTGVYGRDPVSCKIEDNQVHTTSNAAGISVVSGGNHSIRRNLVTGSAIAGTSMTYGILVQNQTGDVDSIDVIDNTCSGASNYDFSFQSGPTNVRFQNNRFTTFNADAGAPYTTFINDKVGQVTVSGATTTGSAIFMGIVNQPFPSTAYQVTLTPVGSTGTPAAGSNRVLSVTKAAASITVTVEVAPGAGNSVTFDYVCRWTP